MSDWATPLNLAMGTAGAGWIGLHLRALFSVRSHILGPHVYRLPPPEVFPRATDADSALPGEVFPARQALQTKGTARIALTFDDGPHPQTTPRVLDTLDHHGVKATFFMIGAWAQRYPKLVAQVHQRGHLIGNHTQSHHHSGIFGGVRYWTRELLDAQQALFDAAGVRTAWFRPPMGHRSIRQAVAASALGYTTVTWSLRSFDGAWSDPDRITQRLLQKTRDRDIVLLHDGTDPRRPRNPNATCAVLNQILPPWQDQGVHIVPLDQALTPPPGSPRKPPGSFPRATDI